MKSKINLFQIEPILMFLGLLLFPIFGFAQLECPTWPRSEFMQISPKQTEFQKERVFQWITSMTHSGKSDVIALLPQLFLSYQLDTHSIWREMIESLLKDMSQNSPLAKDLIKKTQFTVSQLTIIFSPMNNTPVESWSNQGRGDTYIFMTPERCDRLKLISMLAHEIAVRADGKALSYRHLLSRYDSDSLEDLQTSAVLMDPDLYAAFLTRRAFQIEKKILSEMGYAFDGSYDADCIKNIEVILSHIVSMPKAYTGTSFYNMPADYTRMAWALDRVSQKGDLSEKERVALLEALFDRKIQRAILLKEKQNGQNWCEFLSRPEIQHPVPTLMSIGPRPSIGSGTGVSSASGELPTRQFSEVFSNYQVMRTKLKARGLEPLKINNPFELFEHINKTEFQSPDFVSPDKKIRETQ